MTLDDKYFAAIKSGNTTLVLQLVNEAAEIAFVHSKIKYEKKLLNILKPLKVYHGTDKDFTVFDIHKGRKCCDIQGMFFSPLKEEAQSYGPNVKSFFLNIKNPADGNLAYHIFAKYLKENYKGIKTRKELEQLGYDGINVSDEEYIAFCPEQIKSTDPITYDDNGNIIPLSQRFDFENPDFRY